VPVADLFLAWERHSWQSDLSDEAFLNGWKALRQRLGLPQFGRVLTVLEPAYDEGCDCLGFWRLQLPRPGLLHPRRALGEFGRDDILLDLVPERPLAHMLLTKMRSLGPAFETSLGEGSKIVSTRYRLEGPSDRWVPGVAFRHVTLQIEWEDPQARRLKLSATLEDTRMEDEPLWTVTGTKLERDHAPVPAGLKKELPKQLTLIDP
jgi:hypothetical protein